MQSRKHICRRGKKREERANAKQGWGDVRSECHFVRRGKKREKRATLVGGMESFVEVRPDQVWVFKNKIVLPRSGYSTGSNGMKSFV